MTAPTDSPERVLQRLGRVLALTRLGLLAESVTRSFWPLWSLVFVTLAALMMGVQETLRLEALWTVALLILGATLWFLWRGLRQLHWPSKQDAFERLDKTLPGRPLQALQDQQTIGTNDAASKAVWRVHQARMAHQAAGARAPEPDLRVARLDPFGLRYVAFLALVVAILFGSVARVSSVTDVAMGGAVAVTGPSWEGWIEPPAYTGKPALYLLDQPEGKLTLPEGSRILMRLYGQVGALTVSETVSGRIDDVPSAAEAEQDFTVMQSGILEIAGDTGRRWDITMQPDAAPKVSVVGSAEVSGRGELSLPFAASDDYEVTGGTARITLDLLQVNRQFGLVALPESVDVIEVPLPLPISGDRSQFEEALIEDFSKHPWAHLPVKITLSVTDAKGQVGEALPLATPLPARRFFDPLAAAVVELRRDLLWSRENGPRVAQLLRAVSYQPDEDMFPDETSYLRMRTILRRLENMLAYDGFGETQREEISEAMWKLALMLEEGDLSGALARMERARDRLAEAMKNGASDEEIAQLMQELRDATQDYLRELARRQPEDGGQQNPQISENTMTLDQQDLQDMMDRIQELMEQGRMAEAMQALDEFQRMMENMQVTQGQGNGEPSPGEQSMQDLSDTLREQQGLSDQAFRDLQEQFNPNANKGQSQGNEGQSGGEGRGQSHDGTGQGRGNEGQDGESGQTPGQGSLADRQQALRQQLENLREQMPGRGSPEGDAAAEALGRAGAAMDQAEDSLRGNDLADAIDQQARAMEEMREGMRNLGEAMAQQQQGQGQQGREQAGKGNSADPLGRNQGARGPAGTDDGLLQGEDVYREARRLLDEIRRRAGQGDRTEEERGYLQRLLERF
ncbi:TIGR02302 family protein [Shimia gijangensis]|uniref:TIGR02302 family protein n=1 Tax=Shimia gijangensis TaxID=1470563 RepID=A0A1M6FHR4_9RHOB|nr:TIGR02302 family protein [Shimia gijangensis]SHI97264.1 TIGR02302 family protein [Shimia gijangensis]